jgi:hypothetical protein
MASLPKADDGLAALEPEGILNSNKVKEPRSRERSGGGESRQQYNNSNNSNSSNGSSPPPRLMLVAQQQQEEEECREEEEENLGEGIGSNNKLAAPPALGFSIEASFWGLKEWNIRIQKSLPTCADILQSWHGRNNGNNLKSVIIIIQYQNQSSDQSKCISLLLPSDLE